MILTIDAGNTNIVLGGFCGDKLRFVSRISTDAGKTDFEYAATIQSIMSINGIDKNKISGATISSVVPQITIRLKKAVGMVCGVTPIVVEPGIKTGINLLVDDPAQVGADIICACVAAYNLYTPPVLITDMGTATKMIVVDDRAAFMGVSIIPGVEISLKALAGGTARLPQISMDSPGKVIAKNTVECMQSGIIYGNASLVDGMIDRICEEIGEMKTLVATGGLAETIISHCKHDIKIDNDLILKGLYIIYDKNKRN